MFSYNLQETGEEDQELLQEGQGVIANLKQCLEAWQLQRLLSGPYDDHDAVISIQAIVQIILAHILAPFLWYRSGEEAVTPTVCWVTT